MPKHNIKAIAGVCYAAAHAYDQDGQVVEADHIDTPAFASLDADTQAVWTTKVLHEIHGAEGAEQEGGTPDEQRRARLFKAIVKALTVRL